MKLELVVENSFRKDFKKVLKQGNLKEDEIDIVIEKLLNQESLEEKYKDHALIGDLKDFGECRIKSNLLLIYRVKRNNLHLVRLGSHSALFKK